MQPFIVTDVAVPVPVLLHRLFEKIVKNYQAISRVRKRKRKNYLRIETQTHVVLVAAIVVVVMNVDAYIDEQY